MVLGHGPGSSDLADVESSIQKDTLHLSTCRKDGPGSGCSSRAKAKKSRHGGLQALGEEESRVRALP